MPPRPRSLSIRLVLASIVSADCIVTIPAAALVAALVFCLISRFIAG